MPDRMGERRSPVEVKLTEELAKLLEPGAEVFGEWYIRAKELPIAIKKLHHAKCRKD